MNPSLGEYAIEVLVSQVEDGLVDEVVKVLDEHLLDHVEVDDHDALADEAVEANQLLVPVPETKHGLVSKCFKNRTALGKRVVHRLRELVPRGQRESGGGIHPT